MLNGFLDPVLGPMLNALGPFGFVLVISIIVSLLTVIVYKFTTDQVLMKNLKEQIDKMNKEMKKSMHDQKKVMAMQKEMFSKQMTMMKHSFTSTFITLIPILILFGWLNANLVYMPVNDGEQFNVSVSFEDYKGKVELIVPKGMIIVDDAIKNISSKVDWIVSGKTGEYLLEFKVDDRIYNKNIVIGQRSSEAVKIVNDGIVKQIAVSYKQLKILNLLGWQLGWLGSYIIFAIVFSMLLRKLLKVY